MSKQIEESVQEEVDHQWIEEMTQTAEGQILLLLSDGFNDDPVLPLIIGLRKAARSVLLVGFSKKEVRSAQGIVIQPDISLDDIHKVVLGAMLIIPNGRQVHSRIKTDPRVHKLVDSVLSKQTAVVAVPQVAFALRQVLAIDKGRLITWRYQPGL